MGLTAAALFLEKQNLFKPHTGSPATGMRGEKAPSRQHNAI
jgi:hypothetical protein